MKAPTLLPVLPTAAPHAAWLTPATALARTIAELLMANVQNTASLNFSAARALLVHSRIAAPAGVDRSSDQWRSSWRAFEVCATSADQMLNLTRGHVERTTAALWRSAGRLLEDLDAARSEQAGALRAALETMRATQNEHWQATQVAHASLIALAQAPQLELHHDTQ